MSILSETEIEQAVYDFKRVCKMSDKNKAEFGVYGLL